jgi:hypothetical protein
VHDANVAVGTASQISGLILLEAGHTYTFTGAEDDSFLLNVGGKEMTATWGGGGELSGSFTPTESGWYTITAYHDNENGPGTFQIQVGVDGGTAVDLSTSNFNLVTDTSQLSQAGLQVGALVAIHSGESTGYYPVTATSAIASLPSTGLELQTWVNTLSFPYHGGSGTDPVTMQSTIDSTTVAPTSTGVITDMHDANVAVGTATKMSGLILLEAGHSYTFSGSEDDAFLLNVGGKEMTATWGAGSELSGTFTATATGWYTIEAYHDNENGPGNFQVQVSDNGGTALELNTANFHLVGSLGDLNSASIGSLVPTGETTSTGYYPVGTNATFNISLDSLNQSLLANGGTVHLTTSTGSDMTLHQSGNTLVDGLGHDFTYSNGVIAVPVESGASSVTVSATVIDAHGTASDTVGTTLITGGDTGSLNSVGVETFKFELSFNGAQNTPHVETINNFSLATTAANTPENTLDLRDLLIGGSHSTSGDSAVGNLTNYLHFSTVSAGGETSTVIHVSETGNFNANSASGDTAQIVLQNVDLTHSAAGAVMSDHQILQNLLNAHQLQTN